MRYTFRAETLTEVTKFVYNVARGKISKVIIEPYIDTFGPLPDCKVHIETDLGLQEVRDLLKKVSDGHVMVQSVNYSDLYNGERYYGNADAN